MKFIYITLMLAFSANAGTTIWDEMPATQKGRYQYFKKNDGMGVFDAYEKMDGKKYIFACVNAAIFILYAYQDDAVNTPEAAMKKAEIKCEEMHSIPGIDFKLPMGTPILLRYEYERSQPRRNKTDNKKIT